MDAAPPHQWTPLTGELPTLEATFALGRALGQTLTLGTCLTLVGELGSGKTSLCRGIASGFGVEDLDQVTSPTYALVHEYLAPKGPIVHMDFYRLTDAGAALALGLEEQLLRQDALLVLEWPERVASLVPPGALRLELDYCETGRAYRLFAPAPLLAHLA